MSGRVHTKRRADAPAGFFEAEAAGLAWLAAAGGAAVVRVIAVEPGRIDLEALPLTRPTEARARAFGAALAITHDAGAAAFGVPPAGYRGPTYLGNQELPPVGKAGASGAPSTPRRGCCRTPGAPRSGGTSAGVSCGSSSRPAT